MVLSLQTPTATSLLSGCSATFNGNGRLVTSLSNSPLGQYSSNTVTYVALQPDNQIVIAFRCVTDVASGGSDVGSCLARFTATGVSDSAFTNGAPRIASSSSSFCSTNSFALQADGRIVTAGRVNLPHGSGTDLICVLRRTDNGLVDTSFGAGGQVNTPISGSGKRDGANAVALQPDSKLVAVGVCNDNTMCVTRYLGGPFNAQNCSMDVDGDGQVLGTTDALIIARVSLGMSGSAVLSGISFPSHAARKTWPAIRDYLVNQCGMSVVP